MFWSISAIIRGYVYVPSLQYITVATVKFRFNERQNNEIFSGPHQFTTYLYVKMFHFNEYHCNENISLTQ
jgi:hypothetical protein